MVDHFSTENEIPNQIHSQPLPHLLFSNKLSTVFFIFVYFKPQIVMERKERIAREKRLYEASVSGNVESLNQLIQEDQLILARVCTFCFNDTPLHIATMLGHLDFAKALLHYKPDLAAECNSQGSSPLHLASANGYLEIVKLLLSVNSDACLFRDEDGRTPLHLAVMKGQVNVIQDLVQAKFETVQYTVDKGETLLHLAVKHNRIQSLKLLVELGNGHYDFVNVKDNDGNTILHIATFLRQNQTIKYLLSRTKVEVNAVNENGFTTLDIIQLMPKDLKAMEIQDHLLNAGAFRARKCESTHSYNNHQVREASEIYQTEESSECFVQSLDVPAKGKPAQAASKSKSKKKKAKKDDNWLEKKRDSLMVAASVIAAMAYQAALSPPGDVWDHNSSEDDPVPFSAGTSVLAVTHPEEYSKFWIYNTISFISSLSILFLLVSGLPLKRRIFLYTKMAAMWVTITSMAFSYLLSMNTFSESLSLQSSFIEMLAISLYSWLCLIFFALLANIVRFIIKIIRKAIKFRKKRLSRHLSEAEDQHQENV